MNCLICGSSNIESIDTVVSDFVMARIHEGFKQGENFSTKLCYCKDCTFAYYDYRFNEEEEYKLYRSYRDDEYQKLREKYECWYTKKINKILNFDNVSLNEQRNQITAMLFKNVDKEIKISLDYGGNEGRTFTKKIGTYQKFVYDISGVKSIDGVQVISRHEDLKKIHYDFIMCNMLFEHLSYPINVLKKFSEIGDRDTLFYIEVPNENPFLKGNKFSILKNIKLAFNPNYSLNRLVRFYIKSLNGNFMPMKEHINFFTGPSLKKNARSKSF